MFPPVLNRDTVGLFAILLLRRVGNAAFPVALLLTVMEVRGPAAAALLQAIRVIASVCSAPIRARLLDRFGRGIVVPQTVLSMVALIGFFFAVVEVSVWISVPLGLILVQTFSSPVVDTLIRSEWRQIGRSPEQVKGLHAADSVLEETGYLLGPVLVGTLILAGTPALALFVSTTLVIAGALAVFASPAVRRALHKPVIARPAEEPAMQSRGWRSVRTAFGPMATSNLRRIVSPLIFTGTSFGVLGVLIPLSTQEAGTPESAGFLYGAISLGGLIGAFAYGGLRLQNPLAARQGMLTLVVGLPLVPTLVVHHPAPLAAMLVCSGLAVTPLYINSYLMMDDGLSEAVIHEANAWVPVAYNIGYSIGILAAGALAGAGAPAVSVAVGSLAVLSALYAVGILLKSRPKPVVETEETWEKCRP